MLVGSERAAHIPSSFSCACGPAAFTLATSGLIISHCLVVRISISTYSLLPFCLDPEGPSADGHVAPCGATFSAFALGAVSVVADGFSRNLSAPSDPTIACSSEPNVQCLCFSQCSAVSLPSGGIVGAQLLAYPGTQRSALWSNYLIWGNYL